MFGTRACLSGPLTGAAYRKRRRVSAVRGLHSPQPSSGQAHFGATPGGVSLEQFAPFVNGNRLLGLVADLLLAQWGFPDAASSWARYVEHLQALAGNAAEQKRLGFNQFSRGWAIGTAGWRRSLAKELRNKSLIGLAHEESLALREARWLFLLDDCLAAEGKSHAELMLLDECSQPWRLAIADKLHAAGAPYAWLAKTLGFPNPNSLRVKLFRLQGVSM